MPMYRPRKKVIEKGVWIHGQILERGLECDVFIAAGLVDLYCKCGRLVDARKVFDKMWDKDVVVWNAMVAGTERNFLVEKHLDF
ncbi:pentatricopeptide repeat-containing protein [Tanacetum coccineum]